MASDKIIVCSCNQSGREIDRARLEEGLTASPSDQRLEFADLLCRKGPGSLGGPDEQVIVGCTQENQLFNQFQTQRPDEHPIRFVNLRDALKGQGQTVDAAPVVAARLALEQAYKADPVPAVIFQSRGRLAIIVDRELDLDQVIPVAGILDIDVLFASSEIFTRASDRSMRALCAQVTELSGWLGEFSVTVKQSNPVDTELCVECGACAEVCPSGALDANTLTINLDACDRSGQCVKACASLGAINFANQGKSSERAYDLVIDCRSTPYFESVQPPLGYWYAGHSAQAFQIAMLEAVQTVGEFEKPKFFSYKSSICAHGRSGKEGCSACIQSCSTQAISSLGQSIEVNPKLCLGCGACTSVCPTGAIQYALTPAKSLGNALRASLNAFRKSGGKSINVAFHSQTKGQKWLENAGIKEARSSVLPIEVHHPAQIGPDLWLTALAFGASHVVIALNEEESHYYGAALRDQAKWVNEVLLALGLKSTVIVAEPAGWHDALLAEPVRPVTPAFYEVSGQKRSRMEFALEHLAKEAEFNQGPIALSQPAPFGRVNVNTNACTMCMSCTGACPASALIDNPLEPQLRFIERNCVQCGICVNTCPEGAISLTPQLDLSGAAKEKKVLNQSEPFHCTTCGKPFGTRHMIENMLTKLSSHSVFAGKSSLLTQCADCRVGTIFRDQTEMTIHEVKR